MRNDYARHLLEDPHAFLWGVEYRYSPVSPLYLFGRSQDLALQRIRHSINERLHRDFG